MLSKNQQKFVQSLKLKKFRQKYGQFTAEGEKTVRELLKSDLRIRSLFATQNWIGKHGNDISSAELVKVSPEELARISNHQSPQEVLAIVDMPENMAPPLQIKGLCISLDNIQDPGNLGTIIRIADWYGISYIVCSEDCADMYNPKVVSSTMGSFTRVSVIYTELESWLEKVDAPVYATTMDGENIHNTKLSADAVLLIGNEGKGLSKELISLAKQRISIPSFGGAESLNAAVATAIITDNFKRQNRTYI